MAKQLPLDQVEVIGWYQPHRAVDWDGLVADPKTGELVKEPSMTKQSFKDECDINNIVKRFEATGLIDHLNQRAREGVFTDLPDAMDFQGSLEVVRRAQEAFAALPAAVRARFENDPEAFLGFAMDPANQQEMIDMGLAKDTRPPPPPIPPTGPENSPPPAPPPEPVK